MSGCTHGARRKRYHLPSKFGTPSSTSRSIAPQPAQLCVRTSWVASSSFSVDNWSVWSALTPVFFPVVAVAAGGALAHVRPPLLALASAPAILVALTLVLVSVLVNIWGVVGVVILSLFPSVCALVHTCFLLFWFSVVNMLRCRLSPCLRFLYPFVSCAVSGLCARSCLLAVGSCHELAPGIMIPPNSSGWEIIPPFSENS